MSTYCGPTAVKHIVSKYCLKCAFNQEDVLVGAFSVIVKTDGSFEAVIICIENLSVDNQNVSYPLIICLPNYMTLHVQRMLSTLAARPNRK